MKSSENFLFRVKTLDGLRFYLTACCLAEALYKAENYVDKNHSKDMVDGVSLVHGELLEDEEGDGWDEDATEDAAEKGRKLAVVVGRIEGKDDGGDA